MLKGQVNKPPGFGKHRALVGWSIETGAHGRHLAHFKFTDSKTNQ
jgi:hypothetical protein